MIIAGIMAGASILSAMSASGADKEASELEKFQSLIDVERFKTDASIQEYNERRDLASIESEQVAMASAMGKRSTGGSMGRLQEIGREELEANIERSQSEVRRAEKYGEVSRSAIDSARKSRTTQRGIGVATKGLMSLSKAFA